tara:strand:- start:7027 stop:7749 length:723 start_codon:yes stop_codon:yes gene_type:complete
MIFNLFKSKPTLKDLIPKGFVDIHSHILPGIDDGAKNVEESISLISEMKGLGFSKIIGTPHTYRNLYNNTNESITNSFNLIKSKHPQDLNISFASEYFMDENLIKQAENKSLLTLKNNYVLTETGFKFMPLNIFEVIFQLQLNGYRAVLAHPERYHFFSMKDFFKLKKNGVLFQINMFSLIGYYGESTLSLANKLLKNNMIDYIGSDIHNLQQLSLFEKKIKTSMSNKILKTIENNIIFQ